MKTKRTKGSVVRARVEESLANRIQRAAAANGMTASEIVRLVLATADYSAANVRLMAEMEEA